MPRYRVSYDVVYRSAGVVEIKTEDGIEALDDEGLAAAVRDAVNPPALNLTDEGPVEAEIEIDSVEVLGDEA